MFFPDPETWPRKALIEKYASYTFPFINIGEELDVTGLYNTAKAAGLSFYCAMVHAATKIALEIPNFRYRILDGKPVVCESLSPVFTYLPKGEEQFYLVELPYEADMASFCRRAKALAESLKDAPEHSYMHGPDEVEILYMSCLPWIRYTHFVRTAESGRDNIPRMSWGKCVPDPDGRRRMPFSVQVNHALMDGYHVGRYFEKMEDYLKTFDA